DGRRRSLSAEARGEARRALDPLPHARLLPADRRGRERGRDAERGRSGDAAHYHLGAAGPRDRQGRGRRLDGEEEEGGIFLMADAYEYEADALIAEDIDAYLKTQREKELLRFITCGSVDDGKSTLIGRLL